MSASLIYAAQQGAGFAPNDFIFNTCRSRGGMILRPGPSTRVLCGAAADAGANCLPLVTTVPKGLYNGDHYPGDGCSSTCKWAPNTVHAFLRRVNHWQGVYKRPFYNEFVLSAPHWREHLPLTIEAFFGELGQTAHAAFTRRFGAGSALRVEWRGENWREPFAEL